MADIQISAEELLSEVQQLDPRLFDLAAERVAGRKRAERIEELEAQLALRETEQSDA